MHIKTPTAPCMCCYTTLWNVNVSKQAINDKLQSNVATYLRCGWVVNSQIKKALFVESVSEFFLIGEHLAKLQARAWLSHALCATGQNLLKDEESARDNHVVACNFAKYLPI